MRIGTRRAPVLVLAASVALAAGCSTDVDVTSGTRASVEPTTSTPDGTGAATTAPGTSVAEPDEPDEPDVAPLAWGPCDDPVAEDEVLECATLTVPLDHDDPDFTTIDLALVRVPATGDREGAVLFNPGGPGASGFDPIAASGTVIQQELGLERFDIVGFDPRGVDRSGGIECVDDEFLDAHLYLDDTPDTPEERAALEEADSGFIAGCQVRYGDTLRLYSTEATARDMDLVRAALGDEQLSFLGISYGTYLGATYASMFPERVRAMVLDSAFEPNGDTVEQQYLTQLVGFEEAFDGWRAWCEAEPTCAFRADDVGARWDALRERLDAEPVPAADGRLANQAVLDTATGAAMYLEAYWPVLADALARVEAGDPDGLFALADAYSGREADGTFTTLAQSNEIITCASGIRSVPPDDPEALLERMRTEAPRFSAGLTVDDLTEPDGCDELMDPVEPVEIGYAGDGPIVVVGGTNDPATPIRWAEEMVAELGPNARLVTYTGEGHGQLLTSSCVTEIQGAVLADLTLPDEGTVCEPDPKVERPSWWDDIPVPAGFEGPVALPAVEAALGLTDTLGYGETLTTSLGTQAATEAIGDALGEAGFDSIGGQDLGIDDTTNEAYFSPDGELLLVIVLGPDSFDDEALASAAPTVPDGATVVLLAYLPL